jgi:hypothetical protein
VIKIDSAVKKRSKEQRNESISSALRVLCRWMVDGGRGPARRRGLLGAPSERSGGRTTSRNRMGDDRGGEPSARVLWHEMGHGIDYLYGSGEMRTDGEPVGLGGSGAFHEPAAAVMQLVTVARHFSTAYAFNDYDTHAGSLIAQVGSSAGTRGRLGGGFSKVLSHRRCGPECIQLRSSVVSSSLGGSTWSPLPWGVLCESQRRCVDGRRDGGCILGPQELPKRTDLYIVRIRTLVRTLLPEFRNPDSVGESRADLRPTRSDQFLPECRV